MTASEMNTQQKHTPGPWQFSPGHDPHNQAQIYGDDGKTLAVTFSDEGSANAALIAAAPAMLEALRDCLSFWQSPPDGFGCNASRLARLEKIKTAARAAISQAEGGAQ